MELEDSLTSEYANRLHVDLTKAIIGSAIEVHQALGPGLLEATYEMCLVYELQQKGLKVERQKPVPIEYKEIKLDCGYRLDLFVDEKIILEIKSVSELTKIHEAQLVTYLKLSKCKIGLLMNFNVIVMKQGIQRIIV